MLAVSNPIPSNLKSEAKKAAKILRDFTEISNRNGPDKLIPGTTGAGGARRVRRRNRFVPVVDLMSRKRCARPFEATSTSRDFLLADRSLTFLIRSDGLMCLHRCLGGKRAATTKTPAGRWGWEGALFFEDIKWLLLSRCGRFRFGKLDQFLGTKTRAAEARRAPRCDGNGVSGY